MRWRWFSVGYLACLGTMAAVIAWFVQDFMKVYRQTGRR